MASGFFAILDDIGTLMDDVALTTKVAAQKTAGVLGDDLAVNAKKVTGFVASREMPVLWAITKGSLLNKLIIVPLALLLSAFFPAAITVILLLGGMYLAYEGVEKIVEFLFHRAHQPKVVTGSEPVDPVTAEKAKIKAAVTTDLILSVEIVIIALGTVAEEHLLTQIITVAVVALLATIGVYGIVALIVRMDDAGYRLIGQTGNKGWLAALGRILVRALPVIIKILSFVGTLALLLVAGGLFVHQVEALHHLWPAMPGILKELLFGLAGGLLVLGLTIGFKGLKKACAHQRH